MLNIFVTYRCNLACAYCFAREQLARHPADMTEADFERLLGWLLAAKVPAAAFIGGEPTLHPRLADMVACAVDVGVSPVLFTNGLFSEALCERLAPLVANFVVNYNDPAGYAPAQAAALDRNLAYLRDHGAHVTFSKNFSRADEEYDYLLAAADRYHVKFVRYDVSRPSESLANRHFDLAGTRGMTARIVSFVRACEARGLRTGLDCSARLCDFSDADRRYLARVSMKFTGVCHPSLDVHPDLSASYCLPLADVRVPDVTAFPNPEALVWHFAGLARGLRETDPGGTCTGCPEFPRRCQGGCLALKRAGCGRTPQTTASETS